MMPFGPVPQRRVADGLVRPGGEGEARGQTEPAVGLVDLAQQRLELGAELIGAHVDVAVVLDELADAGQAAQRAAALVAMQPPVLVVAQGQVAVRAQVALVDERRFRAVHGLEAEQLLLGLDDEHVLGVVVPVAGLAPQALADEDGRADLLVAAALLELAHGRLQGAPDALALGVPEGRARRDVVEGEQVELHAEAAVVALLGLGPAPQVGVQLLLAGPGRAVHALEHRPGLVAAPVRTGRAQQLERADLARAGHVRAAAQVDERALAVERGRGHGRAVALGSRPQVVDDLDLERLVALDQGRPGLVRRLLAELERVVGRDRLAHARLDGRQVLGGQRPGQQEVVVEAVGDDRADAQLGAREQVQDGLGQDVRGAVAHRAELVAGRAVVHELGRAAPLGDLGQDLLELDRVVVSHLVRPRRITRPLVRSQDERSILPRSHPHSPALVAPTHSWPR